MSCTANTWRWDYSGFARAQVFGVAATEAMDVCGVTDPGSAKREKEVKDGIWLVPSLKGFLEGKT